MLTILWLMHHRTEGRISCREVQLHRECDALCSTDRDGTLSCELKVAVLLPSNPSYDISLPKVLPVLGKETRAEASEVASAKLNENKNRASREKTRILDAR